MNDVLCRQIALDYCCPPEDVQDHRNHFSRHQFLEGRRRFQEDNECFLKIGSGFSPAWVELVTSKVQKEDSHVCKLS